MQTRAIFNNVHPLASMFGFAIAGILLFVTVFLTLFDLPWIAFMSGILCAAALALVSRLAYAETALAEVRENIRYVDDDLPTMLVYVSGSGKVQFHNQAFRQWLHARRGTVDGHLLRDVVGVTVYGQLKEGIEAALSGRTKVDTKWHEGVGGPDRMLLTQYLPHIGERDCVTGAFLLLTDVTSLAEGAGAQSPVPEATSAQPAHESIARQPSSPITSPSEARPSHTVAEGSELEGGIFVDTMAEELNNCKEAAVRLRAALGNNEFCLYCQAIVPVAIDQVGKPFYEMLLRLREEEEGLMPPGAFLPLAEEIGLLPDLDRWVVRNVLDWAASQPGGLEGAYSINVSAPTIADAGFADFVVGEIGRRGLRPSLLCFEVRQADVLTRRSDASRLVALLNEAGCRTALCGFGQNAASFGVLKYLKVDYLKIDGDIILGLMRNPVDLFKLKAITRVARVTNRLTIAELVENEETFLKLREFGVDFAQGFGVSRPMPIDEARTKR